MNDFFRRFAHTVSVKAGSAWAFILAFTVIIVWAVSGPMFQFSDTWQLVINTGTTIVTFLMVFLIQNTQNRDARAMQLKLDELIRSLKGARNELIDLEDYSDEDLDILQEQFHAMHEQVAQMRTERKQTATNPRKSAKTKVAKNGETKQAANSARK
jgi:low affinity Fe/Cu permease